MTQNTYVRFGRPRDDVDGPVLGPFAFVELTYDTLRGPDGETLAMYSHEHADWFIGSAVAECCPGSAWSVVSPNVMSEPFSDIVIYQGETPEAKA